MSAGSIIHLHNNPELFARFKADPLAAIEELCELTGSDAPRRMTAGEIELLQTLSQEEFEVLYSLADRMGGKGITNFRL